MSSTKIQHPPNKPPHISNVRGFTLVEMTLALLIAGLLIVGMDGLLSTALQSHHYSQNQNDTMQQARFAMQQMVRAVTGSRRLLIPLGENPATAWSESVRDVLAVTLDPTMDRDQDGWADANNDKDYLDINNNGSRDAGEPERIDEDLSADNTNDAAHGIVGIDDNGDGLIDGDGRYDPVENETVWEDNDESSTVYPPSESEENEDPSNGIDDDNDGSVDEDVPGDMNKDFAPGIKDVDDDYDGSIDEAIGPAGLSRQNDDEDSIHDEDWLDPVVFFLNGTTLMQRIPNINPLDGTDYTEYPIADNVTQLQVERLMGNDGITVLVDITLQVSPPNFEPVTLNTRVRVGGAL